MKNVPSNYDKLPRGWSHKPELARKTYAHIRSLLLQGYSVHHTARLIGCSSRTVYHIAAEYR